MECNKIWSITADRNVSVEFAQKNTSRESQLSTLGRISNTIANYLSAQPRCHFRSKVANLISMGHNDILRIFGFDNMFPSVGISVGRIGAELFVLGHNDLRQIVTRDLVCQSTILIAR